ncbi:hypothetical protein FSP39_006188 [Pinctada imbricata]|uniref:FAS1 domain-containing protein n=1 Tax=Pinctada imbricata TaxID=66713 RepID=A0AA88XXF3_PINIB|nr:hypothetical protein FSP39_006188 [Pinctada imbricata]
MSKFLLVCLAVLLVAVVSEAGPRGRGRGHMGGRRQRGEGMMMMKRRGKGAQWRRKWAIGRIDGDMDDVNTYSSDDNIPVHTPEMVNRRPVAKRPWKLRRKMRRRNKKFWRSKNAVLDSAGEWVIMDAPTRRVPLLAYLCHNIILEFDYSSFISKLMTANCKRVRSQDNRASNGVIHIVEEVMLPVSDSMVDIVTKDRQLSYLKTAIGRSSLGQALRADGQLTLFAPTDAAFQKLDSNVLNRLLRDQKCLDKVLKNHVLPNVVCSSAIQGKSRTKNLLMRYLSVNRDQEDKVFVQDSQVVSADIMTTNGVIHLIDEVLIPDDALGILDVAEKQNATKVLELIDRAGLRKTLESAENITFFVPTNEAVEKLPSDVLTSLARDTNALANILKYHVTPVETECKFVYNGYELETLSSGKSIVLYEYSTFPFRQRWLQTAQCGRIIMGNIPSCNGLIHLVDKVLLPPVGNILDVLAQDRRFTQLVDLLKRAGLADALQGEGPLTIFAPTNQAFGKIPSSTLQSLASDVDQLQTVLKLHVIKGFLCCAGIFEDNFFHRNRISSLEGTRLRIRKEGDQLMVQSSTISSCDLTGTNGVVHAIDSVILPNQKQRDRSWYGYYYN